MTTVLTRSEAIEKIFQRVEEESAKRAEIEEELEEAHQREAQDQVPSPVATLSNGAVKQRRRGSVTVSRFGQPTELSPEPVIVSTTPSTRPSRSSSLVAATSPFYQVQHMAHGSVDSLASETANDPAKQVEDEHHITQMATFSGKQSLSKAITRRLSRARSREVLVNSATNSMIIGVAVEEATVEHHSDDDDHISLDSRPRSSAAVYSGMQVLRPQRSSPGFIGTSPTEKSGWMSKAKDLTAKFKRKSIAVLSPTSASAATLVA